MRKRKAKKGPLLLLLTAAGALVLAYQFDLFSVEGTKAQVTPNTATQAINPAPAVNPPTAGQAANGGKSPSPSENTPPNSTTPLETKSSAHTDLKAEPFSLAKGAPVSESMQQSVGKDWWIPPHKTGERPIWPKEMTDVVAPFEAVYLMPGSEKTLYLTFDEGYEYGFTPRILETLTKHKVPAAFFVTGHFVESHPDLVKQMAVQGFAVGNHTQNHPDMTKLNLDKQRNELVLLNEKVKQITGITPKYYRPPMGRFSAQSVALAHESGLKTVFWSIAYKDWETDKQIGPDKALPQVMRQLHPGAVILLHAVSKDNAEMLEQFILQCREQGYRFMPLPGEPFPY